MKTILKFFVSWILFGAMLYAIVAISQGSFSSGAWTAEAREAVSSVVGIGGFWFAIFATLMTE